MTARDTAKREICDAVGERNVHSDNWLCVQGKIQSGGRVKNCRCGLFPLKLALFRKDTLREEKDRVIRVSLPLAPEG